ncbi:hypothetical protein CMUST_13685 [Corynebacterium mustelae]|uniref:Uncharacterized protein n=1 Tax=Corynebacterium mustelae TaxID=571915 RepID=A0A0G3H0U1_9CORY|nr:hypothetical protein [Corynebacterium mustelae]AKK07031.1 hypothetical protein CMUST_13685 [Corynebacterium mustelae]
MSTNFGSSPAAFDPFASNQPGQSGAPGFGTEVPGDFGDMSASPRRLPTPVTGPWPFLLAAVLSVGIAVVLGVLAPIIGGSATDDAFRIMAIIGWFLAGIAGFILLGLHIGADNRRKAAGLYIENPTQTLLVRATLALGSIAVVITAVEIALWLSKTIGN